MTIISVPRAARAAITAAAAIGAIAAGAAAFVSYASAVGALPAPLYGRANLFSTLMRAQDVPLEFFACGWFAAVFAAAVLARRPGVHDRLLTYVFMSAVPVSGYLAWLAVSRTAWVPPLVVAAGAAIAVLLAAALANNGPMALRSEAPADLRRWIGSPKARALALIWLAVMVAGAQSIRASVRRVPTEIAGERAFASWFGAQTRTAALDGTSRGQVRVVIYTDYECPACQAQVPQTELALGTLRLASPAPIVLEIRDFPLEPECNAAVGESIHPAACEAAAAVRLAGRLQGAETASAMGVALYRAGRSLSPDLVREQLRARNLETAFVREYPALVRELTGETHAAAALGVRATPSVFVNGIKLRSMTLLKRAVEQEAARVAAGGQPALVDAERLRR